MLGPRDAVARTGVDARNVRALSLHPFHRAGSGRRAHPTTGTVPFASPVCAPCVPPRPPSPFPPPRHPPPPCYPPLPCHPRPSFFSFSAHAPPFVAIMGRAATGKAVKPPTADKMAERLDRAASERMYFMGRVSEGAGILQPFVVTGLSGKVYTINLSAEESAAADAGSVGIGAKCNCPDFIFRRVRGREPPRLLPWFPFSLSVL